MAQLRSYQDIPYITSPRNIIAQLGPFVVKAYEQYGSLFRTQNPFGAGEVLYLVGPEANRFVLTSDRLKFSHHQGWGIEGRIEEKFGHGLLSMDGEEHDVHRHMLNPSFTSSAISQRYFKTMCAIIKSSVASWREKEIVDVHQEARRITFAIIARVLLGLDDPVKVDALCEVVTHLIHLGETPLSSEVYTSKLHSARERLEGLMLPIIRQHRQQALSDDILGDLLSTMGDNGKPGLSDEQLVAHMNILLVAGHETTTSLTAWLFYLLSQNPEYLRRILDELDQLLPNQAEPTIDVLKQALVLDNALSEAQRLYPSIGNGPRGALEDFVFNGFLIPAGTRIFYSIVATHLIPSIFSEPDRFDPDRFAYPREEHKKTPYALIAFGGGPRICLGINFALIEIKLIATYVLRQYCLQLVPGQKIVQIYIASGAPFKGIKMKVLPLKNCPEDASFSVHA